MITSKTNPKIKNLVRLQKASERREQNRILIEGQREIERAQACGFHIEQLYVCESLLREPLSIKADFTETVTEEVFDKIAYREGSDGLLDNSPQNHLSSNFSISSSDHGKSLFRETGIPAEFYTFPGPVFLKFF